MPLIPRTGPWAGFMLETPFLYWKLDKTEDSQRYTSTLLVFHSLSHDRYYCHYNYGPYLRPVRTTHSSRMRRRLKRNYRFDPHENCVMAPDSQRPALTVEATIRL
jgi:hypothetical protein